MELYGVYVDKIIEVSNYVILTNKLSLNSQVFKDGFCVVSGSTEIST